MDFIDAGVKVLEVASKIGDSLSGVISDPELEERLDRIPSNLGAYGVDPFGFDPQYLRRIIGLTTWMYRHYFSLPNLWYRKHPRRSLFDHC